MALIEIDESWEDYEAEEERRREERFPLIERTSVKVQVTGWDTVVSKKKGTPMIQWELTIVEDPEYQGRVLNHNTPTSGRGKFVLKAFYDACKVKLAGKGVDPDSVIGRIVTLMLSIGVTEEGRKYTKIDAVVSA